MDKKSILQTRHIVKYGLKVVSEDAQGDPNVAICRFCEQFGREGSLSSGSKRKSMDNIKRFTSFRVDNIRRHVLTQHPTRWAAYQEIDLQNLSQVDRFFGFDLENPALPATHDPNTVAAMDNALASNPKVAKSSANRTDKSTMKSKVSMKSSPRQVARAEVTLKYFIVQQSIIDKIIGNLLFASNAKEETFEDFKILFNIQEAAIQRLKVQNGQLLELCTQMMKIGYSVQTCSKWIMVVQNHVNVRYCRQYVRALIGISLQKLSIKIKNSWCYSIGLYTVAKRGSIHVNVKLRLINNKSTLKDFKSTLKDFHMINIPKVEQLSGEDLYYTIIQVLNVLDKDWNSKLIGAIVDVNAMTIDKFQVALGCLEQATLHRFDRMWSGSSRFENVLQKTLSNFLNEEFYHTLQLLLEYLQSQGITKPWPAFERHSWRSLGRVVKWILQHQVELLKILHMNDSPYDPEASWWVYLCITCSVTSCMEEAFTILQSFTNVTLRTCMDQVCQTLAHWCYATRPTFDSLVDDQNNQIRIGQYAVSLPNITRYIKDQGTLTTEKWNELDQRVQCDILQQVSRLVLNTMDDIQRISTETSQLNNTVTIGSTFFLAIMPNQWIAVATSDLVECLNKHSNRICTYYDTEFIRRIEEDHKAIKQAAFSEPAFFQTLRKHNISTTFEQAWASLNGRYPYLMEFSTGLATLFPGSLEIDTTMSLNIECSSTSSSTLDLNIEGYMHAKQLTIPLQ